MSAGMEAAIANMLEPGETIVVGNNGIWGQRVADLAQRYGGEHPDASLSTIVMSHNAIAQKYLLTILRWAGNVINMEKEAGGTLSLKEIQDALAQHKPAVLFLCQVRLCSKIVKDDTLVLNSFGTDLSILCC